MKKVDYKGRVIKRQLSKCKDICRSYSEIQDDYARFLQINDDVKAFSCNVQLADDPETEMYTTDFVITLTDSTIRVRECTTSSSMPRLAHNSAAMATTTRRPRSAVAPMSMSITCCTTST